RHDAEHALDLLGDFEQRPVSAWLADDLQPDRQSIPIQADGYRDRGVADGVTCHREAHEGIELGAQWIAGDLRLLANSWRLHGGGRRQNGVVGHHDVSESGTQHPAEPLGIEVISSRPELTEVDQGPNIAAVQIWMFTQKIIVLRGDLRINNASADIRG